MSGMSMRFLDLAEHGGVFRLGHGDADQLAAGLFEPMDLGDGRLDVVGIGRGHRLDDDGIIAADDDVADLDLAGLMTLKGVLVHDSGYSLWIGLPSLPLVRCGTNYGYPSFRPPNTSSAPVQLRVQGRGHPLSVDTYQIAAGAATMPISPQRMPMIARM